MNIFVEGASHINYKNLDHLHGNAEPSLPADVDKLFSWENYPPGPEEYEFANALFFS